MNLAIVDDNPEELQKLYKTIMDYSRTHDVATVSYTHLTLPTILLV